MPLCAYLYENSQRVVLKLLCASSKKHKNYAMLFSKSIEHKATGDSKLLQMLRQNEEDNFFECVHLNIYSLLFLYRNS